MKQTTKKILFWISSLIVGGSWAYSIATRFTDFMVAQRTDKVNIIVSLLVITSLLSVLVFHVLLKQFIKNISKKRILLSFGLCILIVSIFFIFLYELPPFPEHHNLTVTASGKKNSLSGGSTVEIIHISTVSLPGQKRIKIPISQLEHEGIWRGVNGGYGLLASDEKTTSVHLNRFMQAGIEVKFVSGPQSGLAQIIWDDVEYEIDLYNPTPSTYTQSLEPELNWLEADLTRKILVAGAIAADFLGLIAILSVCGLIILQIFSCENIKLRQPGFIFLCFGLILIMQIAASAINEPVIFDNPPLENVVRDLLGKSSGNIYKHQLLTIVQLDAPHKNIANLNGIDQLSNLSDLDLQYNQISDISPLSKLSNLQKINLRNNEIIDLTPLSELTNLEYLNIHSNQNIASIKPLEKLSDLQTLIMTNVPIRDEIEIFENFDNLKYLNLRNCGVQNLESISKMNGLEYLNLYSNPEIFTIESLENLTSLETLILANNQVAEKISFLENLSQLRYLNLRNTDLLEITSLSGLTRLEYLNLHSNPNIQSIEPIQNLTNLQSLIMNDVQVGDDISILGNLPNLHTLNIRNCGINDVSFLGELMEKGILQDNIKLNIVASIDIRDNPISIDSSDNFFALRSFWENISVRQPLSLPFYSALNDPVFSQPAGFYTNEFFLTISNDEPNNLIYYTLDGSEPTTNSPVYSEPLLISSRKGDPNYYSAIETIAADWNKPDDEVAKATIVRAKVIRGDSGETSATVTQTYFVGPDLIEKYSLPIISLVSDPQGLFDEQFGIYVLGDSYAELKDTDMTEDEKQMVANFNQHGREWEQPIHIELFEKTGEIVFSQNSGVRIHGGGSRRSPQKTMRIYARPEYDRQELFTYPLFTDPAVDPTEDLNKYFEVFLLRNSGQDWLLSMFRDAFIQDLVEHTQLDTQSGRLVIVFLNGEYWGIYNLQEKYDEYYLSNHYDIDIDSVTILRQNGVLFRGDEYDNQHYTSMLDYIRENSLSDNTHYEYIQTQMDVDNYIDYLITEIYSGNSDWPDNNIYIWRKNTKEYISDAQYGHDGHWRWMIFDMDFGFGLQGYGEGHTHNTLEHAQMEGWGGFLFRSLLENASFRTTFINRFMDHMNTTFSTDRVLSVIDEYEAMLKSEMGEFLARWDHNEDAMGKWAEEVRIIRDFAQKRPEVMRTQIMNQFDIEGIALLTVKIDPNKGYIRINSIDIKEDLPGVEDPSTWNGFYFKDIPVTIHAIPYPGYQFTGWEGIDNEKANITLELVEDLILRANFIEVD